VYSFLVSVHDQVLQAAIGICRERETWEFRPEEIVEALPHLHPATVRTHVISRLCVNVPANHPHRWPYFARVRRGVYEVLPAYRKAPPPGPPDPRPRKHIVAGESLRAIRDTAHAVVSRDLGWYVAECLEVPVVAQGRTLDEVVVALRAGIERRMGGADDPARFGLTRSPRVVLTFEFRLTRAAPRA
jgi:hypothetical protein